jgi:hypothetical protein
VIEPAAKVVDFARIGVYPSQVKKANAGSLPAAFALMSHELLFEMTIFPAFFTIGLSGPVVSGMLNLN